MPPHLLWRNFTTATTTSSTVTLATSTTTSNVFTTLLIHSSSTQQVIGCGNCPLRGPSNNIHIDVVLDGSRVMDIDSLDVKAVCLYTLFGDGRHCSLCFGIVCRSTIPTRSFVGTPPMARQARVGGNDERNRWQVGGLLYLLSGAHQNRCTDMANSDRAPAASGAFTPGVPAASGPRADLRIDAPCAVR